MPKLQISALAVLPTDSEMMLSLLYPSALLSPVAHVQSLAFGMLTPHQYS